MIRGLFLEKHQNLSGQCYYVVRASPQGIESGVPLLVWPTLLLQICKAIGLFGDFGPNAN